MSELDYSDSLKMSETAHDKTVQSNFSLASEIRPATSHEASKLKS